MVDALLQSLGTIRARFCKGTLATGTRGALLFARRGCSRTCPILPVPISILWLVSSDYHPRSLVTNFGSHPRPFAIFPDFCRFFSPGNFQIFLVSSFGPKLCMDVLHIILNISAKFQMKTPYIAIFPDLCRFFSPGNFQIFLVSIFGPKLCMDVLHIILNISAKFQMKTPYIEEVTPFRKKVSPFQTF